MQHLSAFAVAALAGVATATTYANHSPHSEIDQTNSTKEVGLVLWQPFFQAYVDAGTLSQPTAYSANVHVCWFQFVFEQWSSPADDRYALTARQNCPDALITSFDF